MADNRDTETLFDEASRLFETEPDIGMLDVPEMEPLDFRTELDKRVRRGLFSNALAGLAHGTLHTASGIATMQRWLFSGGLNDEGQAAPGALESWFDEKAHEFDPDPELQGTLWENPGLLRDPNWLVYYTADMIPSFASMMIGGGAAGLAVKLGASKLPWTPAMAKKVATLGETAIGRAMGGGGIKTGEEASTWLARLAGVSAGGAFGGGLEGASTYREVLEERGAPPEVASAAAYKMAAGSAVLNAIGLGKLTSRMKSKALDYLVSGSTEALTEWAEEPWEAYILDDDIYQAMKDGLNVAPPAMLLGIGGRAVVRKHEGAFDRTKETVEDRDREAEDLSDFISGEDYFGEVESSEDLSDPAVRAEQEEELLTDEVAPPAPRAPPVELPEELFPEDEAKAAEEQAEQLEALRSGEEESGPDGPFYFQWQRAPGRKAAKQQVVVPLNQQSYTRWLRPMMAEDAPNTVEEYISQHPEMEGQWLSISRMGAKGAWSRFEGRNIDPNQLRPQGKGVRPVSSLISREAMEWANIEEQAEKRPRTALSKDDDVQTALAKIGGLNRAEWEAQGIDPAEFKYRTKGGHWLFPAKGGMSADAAAERLAELGFNQVYNEDGVYDANKVLDLVVRALAGEMFYTYEKDEYGDSKGERYQTLADLKQQQAELAEEKSGLVKLQGVGTVTLEDLDVYYQQEAAALADAPRLHEDAEYVEADTEESRALADLIELALEVDEDAAQRAIESGSSDTAVAGVLWKIVRGEPLEGEESESEQPAESAGEPAQKGPATRVEAVRAGLESRTDPDTGQPIRTEARRKELQSELDQAEGALESPQPSMAESEAPAPKESGDLFAPPTEGEKVKAGQKKTAEKLGEGRKAVEATEGGKETRGTEKGETGDVFAQSERAEFEKKQGDLTKPPIEAGPEAKPRKRGKPTKENALTYDEFKKKYEALVKRSYEYNPKQAGFKVISDELADLAEANPGHEERYDAESDMRETLLTEVEAALAKGKDDAYLASGPGDRDVAAMEALLKERGYQQKGPAKEHTWEKGGNEIWVRSQGQDAGYILQFHGPDYVNPLMKKEKSKPKKRKKLTAIQAAALEEAKELGKDGREFTFKELSSRKQVASGKAGESGQVIGHNKITVNTATGLVSKGYLEHLNQDANVNDWRFKLIPEEGVAAPAKSEDASPAPKADTPYTIEHHKEVRRRLAEGEITAEEYKAEYRRLVASRPSLEAHFKAMTIKQMTGGRGSRLKKPQLINAIIEQLHNRYLLGRALTYTMSQISNAEAMEAARLKLVESTTDKDLQTYAKTNKDNLAKKVKAIKNPETLEEFNEFIHLKGKKALTPEQLATYDGLVTKLKQEQRQAEKERRAKIAQVDTAVEMKLVETVHTKKGHKLWVVQLSERVDKEVYQELRAAAKRLGGYYSSYVKNGAVPGFQFKDEESAKTFMQVKDEDVAKPTDESTPAQRSSARLREMADKLEAKAEESLTQDRRSNTARQAAQAASATANAYADQAFARTLRNIADATDAGTIEYLGGIRYKADLERLSTIARQAHYEADRKNGVRYDESQETNTRLEDIDIVEFPDFTFDKESVNRFADLIRDIRGGKMLADRLRKRAAMNDRMPVYREEAEKVQALIKKRPGSSYDKSDWQLDERLKKIKQLERMGIKSSSELRSALRELLTLQAEKGRESELAKKERALIGGAKIPGFFPTPERIVRMMTDLMDWRPGMRVLEPSAGKGDIIDGMLSAFDEMQAADIDALEISSTLRELLGERDVKVVGNDFTAHKTGERYDYVVMNPPFEKGAEMDHVERAYGMLKPGGRLISVMSSGPFFRGNKREEAFRSWLEETEAVVEDLPDGAFKDSFISTGVQTKLVVIDKPADINLSLTSAEFNPAEGWDGLEGFANRYAREFEGVQIRVVETTEELARLHPAVRREFNRRGGQMKVRGMASMGATLGGGPTVYLVRENLHGRAEAEKVLNHELTHVALNMSLGAEKGVASAEMRKFFNKVVFSAAASSKMRPHLHALAMKYKRNLNSPNDRIHLGHEFMAQIGEEALSADLPQQLRNLWSQFVTMIRKVMRKLMPSMNLSESEIRSIIISSVGRLRRPPAQVDTNLVELDPRLEQLADRWYFSNTVAAARMAPPQGTPEDYADHFDRQVKLGQVSRDELQWLGIEDWLSQRKAATREELAAFIGESQVELTAVKDGELQIKMPGAEKSTSVQFETGNLSDGRKVMALKSDAPINRVIRYATEHGFDVLTWPGDKAKAVRRYVKGWGASIKSFNSVQGVELNDAMRSSAMRSQPLFNLQSNSLYSPMHRVLSRKLPPRLSVDELRRIVAASVRKGEFKSAELDFVGLQEWIDEQEKAGKKRVTREEILGWMVEQTGFEEINLTGAGAEIKQQVESVKSRLMEFGIRLAPAWNPDGTIGDVFMQATFGANQFTSMMYNLPEQLTQEGVEEPVSAINMERDLAGLPALSVDDQAEIKALMAELREIWEEAEAVYSYLPLISEPATQYAMYTEPGGEDYTETLWRVPYPEDSWTGETSKGEPYRSGHWTQTNVFVHARTTVRQTPDGRRFLFAEEVQSDYAQEELGMIRGKRTHRYNPLPHEKTYPQFAFRRLWRRAIEQNLDGVAWISGEMSRDRWDTDGLGEAAREGEPATGIHKFVYNEAVPNYAKKYVRKWGARVEPVGLLRASKHGADADEVFTVQGVKITERARRELPDADAMFSLSDEKLQSAAADNAVKQQRTFLQKITEQPVDHAFRAIFMPLGYIDEREGTFHIHKQYKDAARRAVAHADAMLKSHVNPWMAPFLQRARGTIIDAIGEEKVDRAKSQVGTIANMAAAGLIDRYGQPEQFQRRSRAAPAERRTMELQLLDQMRDLSKEGVDLDEARAMYEIVNGEATDSERLMRLSAPIREALDMLGQIAVEKGILDRSVYEANKKKGAGLGGWIHRSYLKHESESEGLMKWAESALTSRRKRIHGDWLRRRGLGWNIEQEQLLRDTPKDWWGRKNQKSKPDTALMGAKFRVFDLMQEEGVGVEPFPGMEEAKQQAVDHAKIKDRVYWPDDVEVPKRFEGWEDRGTFEVTGTSGKRLTIWRDWTKTERISMGEIMDARYAFVKSFLLLSRDIATGSFFDDIAKNREGPDAPLEPGTEWSTDIEPAPGTWVAGETRGRLNTFTDVEWVQVPETNVSGTKSKRYGNLAGRWVKSYIWRDMNEVEQMQKRTFWKALLTEWKLNKTARNPVVHMNNVMANFIFADLADVRARDFYNGLIAYFKQDENYREMQIHGGFGHDFLAAEIKRDLMDPIIKQLEKEQIDVEKPGGLLRVIGRASMSLFYTMEGEITVNGRTFRLSLPQLYQIEDEWMRMSMYMRKRSLGWTPREAADAAREQFIDYDIRAPWINAMRGTVLPFLSYTYRAVPIIAKSIRDRPWKLAKYVTVGFLANMLGYMLDTGDDEPDEDEERRSLRSQEQGRTIFLYPRYIRTPMRDDNENPIFLDVRRWVPAGDVFDLKQGSPAIPIPAPLQFGGPLAMAFELMLNKQAYTGQPIHNELTDTQGERYSAIANYLWKSSMPAAAWMPNSWYWEQIGRAARGEKDAFMRDYSLPLALSSSFGIKLRPHDVELGFRMKALEFTKQARGLTFKREQIEKMRVRGALSKSEYDRQVAAVERQLKTLAERAQRTFKGKEK